jgi:DNA repair photolyase
MSDQENIQLRENVIEFPTSHLNFIEPKLKKEIAPTPLVDAMEEKYKTIDLLSTYKSQFDWDPLRSLERRATKNPIRGGIVFKSPFKLVNSHSTCQQCLYAFEVDTYGRGCVHNCVYCYAKAELTVHGYWNNPYPVPVDLNEIRKTFYTVFETDKKNKWREIMEQRIPIRIGSMSDSFMWMDDKIKVTKEFLRILDFYNYPYVVFTRSDLIAREDYLPLIRKDLAAIQFSMSSTNDELNRKIEPGAPSAKRRLVALEKISKAGYWTTVRINPLFPIHPDGFYTDPNFKWDGPVPKFDFSSFEMVDQIADAGVPSILTGFGRFSSYSLNQIEKATGFNLRQLYKEDIKKSTRDYHFSDREIRYYYEQIKKRCNERSVQFTTCYIGNGEGHFWKDQDIWSNKKDCCNIKGRVKSFVGDSRQVPFESRLKFTNHKSAEPNTKRLHERLGSQDENAEINLEHQSHPTL